MELLQSSVYIYIYSCSDHKSRFQCWDLEKRGTVGDTILHLCLLNATQAHADLAKRLLYFFPKMINDIYVGEEYYGKQGFLLKRVLDILSLIFYFSITLFFHSLNSLKRFCYVIQEYFNLALLLFIAMMNIFVFSSNYMLPLCKVSN